MQEYFLVACALDDIIKTYLKSHDSFTDFPAKVAIQINDTHPSLAVAELMRRLLDEYALPWDTAWEITQASLAYTNHTLLPEALEKWSVSLFEYVLPRHLQIIYDINERFLRQVATVWPNDLERLQRMSIIAEGDYKRCADGPPRRHCGEPFRQWGLGTPFQTSADLACARFLSIVAGAL